MKLFVDVLSTPVINRRPLDRIDILKRNIPIKEAAPYEQFRPDCLTKALQVEPTRNLSGRFDRGWPHFGEGMTEQIQHMVRHGLVTLVFINYHHTVFTSKEYRYGYTGRFRQFAY